MSHAPVSFVNDRGLRLAGSLHRATAAVGRSGASPAVVLCNPFTGFKELTSQYRLAKGLGAAGITALRFDYADCIGGSEGSCEEMSVTNQVADTRAALSWLADRGHGPVGLFGHSLGGMTALTAALEEPRVRAIAVLATLVRPSTDGALVRYGELARRDGEVSFESWKRGTVTLGRAFFDDLEAYDATELASRLDIPLLVVQPGDDEHVPREDAERIRDAAAGGAAGGTELLVVEGADHLLTERDALHTVVDAVVGWFSRQLVSGA